MQAIVNSALPWHEAQFRRLVEERDRLPHALLVHGPQGTGKVAFARALAKSLLCEFHESDAGCGRCAGCGWFESGTHPDFRMIEPAALADIEQEEQGAGKASTRILIEQIRALADFVNISSHRGGAKAVVIHPAEALNVNAANALLKNLEEPPEGTFFILVAHRIHFLLATLRSRCRQIVLPMPAPESAVAWLAAQGVREPALALAHTGNAPLLAQELEEREYWQQRDAFLAQVAVRRFDPLAAAEHICDYPLRDVVSWLQKWTFDLVLQRHLGKVRYNPDRVTAIAALAVQMEPLAMLRFHRHTLALQGVIDHPLNPRLLVEQLLLDYSRALTGGTTAS
jgi:DNA polymerase-3 subunit delta'